jgi:hypothetical protein
VISGSAITRFSLGTRIVSHHANSMGIPELDHEQNALLASSGPGVAAGIVRAFHDDVLRRPLESGATETYGAKREMAAGQRPVHARSVKS